MKRFGRSFGILILAFGLPFSVWAAEAGSQPEITKFPWNSPDYTECGQNCTYKKAAEHYSVQALYLLNKLDAVKAAVASKDHNAVQSLLGPFCRASGLTGKPAALFDCARQYENVQLLYLYNMRRKMIETEDQTNKLDSKGVTAAQKPFRDTDMRTFWREGDDKKKSHVPYIPKQEELLAEAKKLRAMSSNEYEDWRKSLPTKPSEDDFIVFKQIPRDPSNPNGEKFFVIDTDEKGKPKRDLDSYKKAMKAYESRQTQLEHFKKSLAAPGVMERTKPDSKSDPVSVGAYNEARKSMIDATNKSLGVPNNNGVGSKGVSHNEQGRAPAANARVRATGKEEVKLPAAGQKSKEVHIYFHPNDLLGEVETLGGVKKR